MAGSTLTKTIMYSRIFYDRYFCNIIEIIEKISKPIIRNIIYITKYTVMYINLFKLYVLHSLILGVKFCLVCFVLTIIYNLNSQELRKSEMHVRNRSEYLKWLLNETLQHTSHLLFTKETKYLSLTLLVS